MPDVTLGQGNFAKLKLAEQSSNPSTPASGFGYLYSKNDGLYLITDDGVVVGPLGAIPSLCDGRLTLTSGTAVTTSDVTAATSVYFTPFEGNQIALYDSVRWKSHTFTEVTGSLSGLAADTNYDVYVYSNSGTITLDLTAWTNATTRATALTKQDGVYVKTGSTGRRFVGTIRTTSTIGQCEDSVTKRLVANYYNARRRRLYKETGAGHSYSVADWRAWNNDSAQKLEFIWLGEHAMEIQAIGNVYPTADGNIGYLGVGIDGFATGNKIFQAHNLNQNSLYVPAGGYYAPSASGYHYFTALEYGNATSAINLSELFFSGLMWG